MLSRDPRTSAHGTLNDDVPLTATSAPITATAGGRIAELSITTCTVTSAD